MDERIPPPEPLPMRRVYRTWWPLAVSWLLMGLELPAVSAILARLAQPEISLAAYGGIVFPLSLLIEAPIIMLLAASTALSKDWHSYCLVRRFMRWSGAVLTTLHVLLAFTPLFDVVVSGLIGAPEEIREATRIGLRIMTPWTGSIAYRRFQHGVLIRFGRSGTVGIGTAVRLGANWTILALGLRLGNIPGVVVGATAVAVGVVSEATFVGIRARAVIRDRVRPAPPVTPRLTFADFLTFYVPLALTSLIVLLVGPIGSAGMSRMPLAVESLAVWPVVNGLGFLFRGIGLAFNEVVVALLDEVRSARTLRRFGFLLAGLSSFALLLIAATPASRFWFEGVSSLAPPLARLGEHALWIVLLMPGQSFFQSWFTGVLVHGRKTGAVTEAVGISLGVSTLVIVAGVVHGQITGLFVGVSGVVLGAVLQVLWLWYRSRGAVDALWKRDEASV
jgi:hypothetical protein